MEQAEILFEGARSKGAGVVQFSQVSEAETAIGKPILFCGVLAFVYIRDTAKFQQYMYGGRPLGAQTTWILS